MPQSSTNVLNAGTKATASEIQPSLASLSSAEFGWNGVLVERLMPPPIAFDDSPEWFMPEYSLAVQLSPPQTMLWKHAGGEGRDTVGPGAVNLFSASEPRRAGMSVGYEVLVVCLEPGFVQQALWGRSSCSLPELAGGFNVTDPLIEHISRAFLVELEAGGPNGRLFGEHLASALAVHLLTRYAVHPAKLKNYACGLGKSHLSQVLALIGDRLADDLSLDDLAASVHLSPYHFSRLFKQSIGQSPHQYVIAQRVEKAKTLLGHGGLTIGEVAQAVGFYDQAHLIRHFKKQTGTTPGRFREGR